MHEDEHTEGFGFFITALFLLVALWALGAFE